MDINEIRNSKPFLKWAGGKKQLLKQYESFFPEKINRYFEPFVGGGAVYFYLWNNRKIFGKAHLFDTNEELINVYKVVRDNVDELIEALIIHKERHCKEYYYHIRNLDRAPFKPTSISEAARTIYLNRTCYNGLFRVNSKGQFNVPMGSYKNPGIVFPEELRNSSLALRHSLLRAQDFSKITSIAISCDFIYFDPPYHPISQTASFTSYTSDNFGVKDQEKLADTFYELSERKCLCMLSNSDTPLIRDLYKKFTIVQIFANRAINSDPKGRQAVKELLILNYN